MRPQAENNMLLYVAGELEPADRAEVERTLAADAEARRLAAQLRADLAMLAPLAPEPVDAALRDRITAAASRARRVRTWRLAGVAAGVAAVAAAVVLAIVLGTLPAPTAVPQTPPPSVAKVPDTAVVLARIERLSDDIDAFEDFESELAEADAGDLDAELQDIGDSLDGLAAQVHQMGTW